MTAIKEYAKSVRDNLAGFLPTQPLGSSSAIGDLYSIGVLDKSKIEKVGNIYNLDAAVPELHATKKVDKLNLQSAKGIKTTAKVKGKGVELPGSAIGIDEAGLTIELQSDSSYIFVAEGLSYKEPRNMLAFFDSASDSLSKVDVMGHSSLWLVTRIAEVDRYTLALAKDSSAVFEVGASGSLSVVGVSDLASAEASLRITRTQNLQYSVLSSVGAGIFFFAKKVRVGGAMTKASIEKGKVFYSSSSYGAAAFDDVPDEEVQAFLESL